MLQRELEELEELANPLLEAGRALMDKCQESIFPCDALGLTVLARAVNIYNGFKLLISGKNYECAASLLRLNLDNILRFYGVTTCDDPHQIADEMLSGTPLRKIKHSKGGAMNDAYLVKLLGNENPWLADAYDILSGFIHLSDRHFEHMLLQSVQSEDGVRTFRISDGDDHVPDEQKANLVHTFAVVTRGTTALLQHWADTRDRYGPVEELHSKFTKVV